MGLLVDNDLSIPLIHDWSTADWKQRIDMKVPTFREENWQIPDTFYRYWRFQALPSSFLPSCLSKFPQHRSRKPRLDQQQALSRRARSSPDCNGSPCELLPQHPPKAEWEKSSNSAGTFWRQCVLWAHIPASCTAAAGDSKAIERDLDRLAATVTIFSDSIKLQIWTCLSQEGKRKTSGRFDSYLRL